MVAYGRPHEFWCTLISVIITVDHIFVHYIEHDSKIKLAWSHSDNHAVSLQWFVCPSLDRLNVQNITKEIIKETKAKDAFQQAVVTKCSQCWTKVQCSGAVGFVQVL